MKHAAIFGEVLDAADALSLQQQEDLVRILQNRMIDQKREALAQSVQEARAEYARGEVKKGSVADLMKDLEK
ncbi:MAG: hypothetical protein PHO14_09200 [Kiritimatiellae bacterium]|jgi:hypothetical protein|nr:hypothetical protein [Kiritimatiellia bacterium]MDD4342393.1 hypothetical protein [Kiritimatiellia bacterium]